MGVQRGERNALKQPLATHEMPEGGGGGSAKRPLSQLAVVITFTVIFFTILTQRMMLSNESSALELLALDAQGLVDTLHKAAEKASYPVVETEEEKSAVAAMATKSMPKPDLSWQRTLNQSLSALLQDYVSDGAQTGGSNREVGGSRLRGQKVKQLDLVMEEQGGAKKKNDVKPPKTSPGKSASPKPTPKQKPKPKPFSPLDGLPPPPNPNYHPLVSPRPGTDISPQNQLSVLRCQNQTKCIVPELQLEAKLKVYFCRHPARHGVRFYYLVREGLHLHPNVELLPFEKIDDADFVIYLPGSSPWHLTECTDKALHSKLLVLDEFDGYNMFHPFERIEQVIEVYGKNLMWYFMYFKRSFVARRDGKFLSHPHLSQPDVYPITYALAEAYVSPSYNFQRAIDILCTLRGSSKMVTRMRVQEWIAEYAKSRNVVNAITEQVCVNSVVSCQSSCSRMLHVLSSQSVCPSLTHSSAPPTPQSPYSLVNTGQLCNPHYIEPGIFPANVQLAHHSHRQPRQLGGGLSPVGVHGLGCSRVRRPDLRAARVPSD